MGRPFTGLRSPRQLHWPQGAAAPTGSGPARVGLPCVGDKEGLLHEEGV